MNIAPITKEEATITVVAEPEHVPVEGNASGSGDDDFDREVEHGILSRLQQDEVWAWAAVTVVVAWNGLEGTACLGCCSYADEADFRQPDGYFDDLVNEALDQLNQEAEFLYLRFKAREN